MDQRFWIGVASADHVARGRAGGFMQLCHGKEAPLRRIRPGDGIAYYSPAQVMRGTDGLQSFTAIGFVAARDPYLAEMGRFALHRRDVAWALATPAAIRPMLQSLSFTRGRSAWGAAFRFGILQIGAEDFEAIATAMQAALPFHGAKTHIDQG